MFESGQGCRLTERENKNKIKKMRHRVLIKKKTNYGGAHAKNKFITKMEKNNNRKEKTFGCFYNGQYHTRGI